MAERYYCGQFWESFNDPIAALVDAGFPKGFAKAEVKTAGWRDVFVAFDEHWGVRLAHDGDRWDRWLVRFDPLLSTGAGALYESRRLVAPARGAEVTSVFTWNGSPRRPVLTLSR